MRKLIMLTLVAAAGSCSSGTSPEDFATSTLGPTEIPENPPTFTTELDHGGTMTVRLTEFHPPRGGQLVAGGAVWVTAEVEVPTTDQIVVIEARGSRDERGEEVLETSFWGFSAEVAFVCSTNPVPTTTVSKDLGYKSSKRTPYPRAGDPDVPFLRLSVWVEPFAQACNPPNQGSIDLRDPDIVILERLDWTAP